MRQFFVQASPVTRLLFAGLVTVFIFLLFMLLSVILAAPVFGVSLLEIPRVLSDSVGTQHVAALKYFQIVQELGLFLIPPLLIAPLLSYHPGTFLGTSVSPDAKRTMMVILLMFMAAPFINFTAYLNSQLSLPEGLSGVEQWMKSTEQSADEITKLFLNVNTTGGFIVNILMIGILPAIGEELLFRGLLQRLFSEMTRNYHAGIFIAAFLFSALHLQFFGFLPRFLMGVFFGYLLVWSGSIWLPIIAHFVNNTTAVVVFYLMHRNVIPGGFDEIGSTPADYSWIFISTIVLGVLIYLIRRNSHPEKWKIFVD
ncbi:MAG TPA: CPBP family intramembrane glutamic endopeptidase [Bacteroidales bacterium]|nr:CPBP family intramembrane glutamic endopeptidase [Bacteroidales bacterium]